MGRITQERSPDGAEVRAPMGKGKALRAWGGLGHPTQPVGFRNTGPEQMFSQAEMEGCIRFSWYRCVCMCVCVCVVGAGHGVGNDLAEATAAVKVWRTRRIVLPSPCLSKDHNSILLRFSPA